MTAFFCIITKPVPCGKPIPLRGSIYPASGEKVWKHGTEIKEVKKVSFHRRSTSENAFWDQILLEMERRSCPGFFSVGDCSGEKFHTYHFRCWFRCSFWERKEKIGYVRISGFEMYEHTKNVNSYYFGEIGVSVHNEGTIATCRELGFTLLEQQPDFLNNKVYRGSYEEEWSLRKVLRRFIWHDRIHAKAMYRMAIKTFGADVVPNIFQFDI